MKWAAIVVVSASVGAIAWFWLAYPSYTYEFRLMVDIGTLQGLKSGSSVIELTWRKQVTIGPRGAVTQVKGDRCSST